MAKIVVIGSLNIDFVVNVPNMPEVGETLLADHFDLIPGGKGANQACALGKLGADVMMLGAVGNDSYGDMELESLRSAGVDVSRVARREDCSSGIALITVNGQGDNSIVVIQGANKTVDRAYIDQNRDVIESCDLVIFQLEIPMDTVCYAALMAKQLGKTVILDPAPAPHSLPPQLMQCVDYLKPNETELTTLTGRKDAQEHLKEATDELKQLGAKSVLVTLGKDGVFLNLSDGSTATVPAKKVRTVDTTAAGDSFTAGFAYGLSRGEDALSAVDLANRVAAVVVTRKGAQSSIPTIEEVQNINWEDLSK